jgi:hypothetical protein
MGKQERAFSSSLISGLSTSNGHLHVSFINKSMSYEPVNSSKVDAAVNILAGIFTTPTRSSQN